MSLDEAEIRRLVHKGMARPDAQVSVDEAVHALGDLEPDPEIIEHLRTRLAEHGVELESAESDVAALLDEEESDLVERRQRDRQQLLVRESMRSGSGGTPLADPVRMYLREIGRVPLLTAQEERELSALIQRGIAAAARLDDESLDQDPPEERARLRREVRRGEAARTELTQANLRLVVSIAKRYATSSMPLLDLVQEGNLGLMRAVEKFDGEKGFKFSTYATWWIRQAITRAVADQSRTIRIPVHMVEAMNKLLRIRIDLTQRLEREPTLDELAAAADLPLERVEELLRIAVDPLSLDMPMGEESDASLGDRVQDDSADSPAEVAETVMLHQAVAEALADLAPREQELLRMRFGLDDGRPRTLEEVARSFNVTRERVRQIETKTLMKLGRSDHGVRLIEYLQN
ncbi:MAG: sigma-70 family RNA polymerase sigma factor [Acidobacteria bacterium]|nr:sigma-70 family RNA polymerase sigma factor [Acidobacteriota bacterium]